MNRITNHWMNDTFHRIHVCKHSTGKSIRTFVWLKISYSINKLMQRAKAYQSKSLQVQNYCLIYVLSFHFLKECLDFSTSNSLQLIADIPIIRHRQKKTNEHLDLHPIIFMGGLRKLEFAFSTIRKWCLCFDMSSNVNKKT